MTTRRVEPSNTSSNAPEVLSIEECAEVIIHTVEQLRSEAGLADDQAISIYVTDVPLIRSTFAQKDEYIREKTKAVDVVRVNVKAGIPMPAHLPQQELHNLDESPATIGIQES